MDNRTTLQQTAAFYCREFLEELSGFHDMLAGGGGGIDPEGFAAAIEEAMKKEYRGDLVDDLYRRLRTVSNTIMAVYSQNPEFTRFERFYLRCQSLMEMCRTINN